MSLRKITDQQFSQGTTADGSRMEAALQSLEDHINEIEGWSIETRWIPQTVHFGYLTNTQMLDVDFMGANPWGSLTPQAPWLPICNNGYAESNEVENQFRLKGTRLPFQPEVPQYSNYGTDYWISKPCNQLAWSVSYAFSRPTIFDSIFVSFMVDDEDFVGTFQYDSATAPPTRTAGDWVKDIQIIASLDNPYSPEDQQTHNMIYHKTEFSAEAWLQQPSTRTPTSDFTPNLKGGISFNTAHSFMFNETDMKIPIPPGSRLRFSIVLPFFTKNDVTGSADMVKPWMVGSYYRGPAKSFVPSVSLTFLEPMLNA